MFSKPFFDNCTILITGGTGSFGRAMAKKLLTDYKCKKVIIFSRDEWKQWEMQRSDPIFNHENIRYFLGDVRDLQRLTRAFNGVDYVIHTAALKQVPAAEYNPSEFVKTNVLGAMNIIEASINSNVKQVIALSTDKACYPVNLYGATKLCSDKLFVNGNAYVGAKGHPIFSVVRYGNVFGSRGSIISQWMSSAEKGATSLPITDERMTRFWITLEQSVDFVIKCFSMAQGGEIYVPKIPSMKIVDLAHAIAPELPLENTGIREGEKLHEMMVSAEDARHSREYSDHYMIIPESQTHNSLHLKNYLKKREGKELPEGFAYTSETNDTWLESNELKRYIDDLKQS
ncbi:MAG: UDP-N-acetylglucosamine 4,6-dehydratase (inverting) [Chlamydiota bacterium]|nr:UDP-N-acetylglucosamine 4,6-dehydratase (inverting) [Chlamydiota bacterium]